MLYIFSLFLPQIILLPSRKLHTTRSGNVPLPHHLPLLLFCQLTSLTTYCEFLVVFVPAFTTVRLGWTKFGFFYFQCYVSIGMLLKGLVESSLLFEGEPITPNIDKAMPVWIFRRRARNTKIGKNTRKFDFSDFVYIFSRPTKEEMCRNLSKGVRCKRTQCLKKVWS